MRKINRIIGFLLLVLHVGCLSPVKSVIQHHRQEATQWDGSRCPMYPSCAAWADDAIDQYGWLGFLLSVDRLFVREFGSMSRSYYVVTPYHLSKSPRYYDPLDDSFGKSQPSLFTVDEIQSQGVVR